jgi:NADPH2:quinone reductase
MNDETQQAITAIEISEFGNADVLKSVKRPMPVIADGEVLIRVHAAGVNRPDIIQRIGKYPPPPGVTDIPGLEVAGEVVQTKSDKWNIGDKICALLAGGGYAEYAAVCGDHCLEVPENLTMIEAAALPETVFTVWNNLFIRGQLKNNDIALVHGGSSGIGTTAIKMAKLFGADILVTAGSEEKCLACNALGADLAINYKDSDFVEEVNKFTNNEGVDVVLDMVGGEYVSRNLDVLKTDGRHVSIAFIGGINAQINIKELMLKRIVLTGSTLRARSVDEKASLTKDIEEYVWPFVISGELTPSVYKVFNLCDAELAHKEMEAGEHIGKIVLNVI